MSALDPILEKSGFILRASRVLGSFRQLFSDDDDDGKVKPKTFELRPHTTRSSAGLAALLSSEEIRAVLSNTNDTVRRVDISFTSAQFSAEYPSDSSFVPLVLLECEDGGKVGAAIVAARAKEKAETEAEEGTGVKAARCTIANVADSERRGAAAATRTEIETARCNIANAAVRESRAEDAAARTGIEYAACVASIAGTEVEPELDTARCTIANAADGESRGAEAAAGTRDEVDARVAARAGPETAIEAKNTAETESELSVCASVGDLDAVRAAELDVRSVVQPAIVWSLDALADLLKLDRRLEVPQTDATVSMREYLSYLNSDGVKHDDDPVLIFETLIDGEHDCIIDRSVCIDICA
jgi:hypothetical protein